jgi:hypothetical protein
MFGGLAFLVNGHMSVTVSGRGGLLVRLDPDDAARLLDGEVVQPFEMRGSPMRGWLRVESRAPAPSGVTAAPDAQCYTDAHGLLGQDPGRPPANRPRASSQCSLSPRGSPAMPRPSW